MSDNIVTEALVNKKTGEVVEIGLQKTPDEIMEDAAGAARALEKLIDSNKRKPLEFNGKRYLEYPHWQTIAKFYHTSAATGEAIFVEINGIKGFKAVGRVFDEKNGALVGSAEAYCMTDEPNWKHKPLFQLASMAQTRAASKALSNKYRYVAIVAGYEPTPGEEIDLATEKGLSAPKEIAMAPPPPEAQDKKITDKQRKMLFARSRECRIAEDALKAFLKSNFGIEHTRELTRSQFEIVLEWIDDFEIEPEAA